MKKNILYSKEDCVQSKRIALLLKKAELKFEERDLNSREALAWLGSWGIFASRSPLLVIDDNPLRFLDSDHLDSMPDKNLLVMIR